MNTFINLQQLNDAQLEQYRIAVSKAFPSVISESQVIKNNWSRLENYFPELQLFLISGEGEIIGFINTVPFQFNRPETELPNEGWDWMLETGISGFENNRAPNSLGGLQIIVIKKYQNSGYSKPILEYAKKFLTASNLSKFFIPIRPTRKHEFPEMSMSDYLNLKDKDRVYDPWIRTHLKSGAEIIKVCENSMSVKGDLKFWETILNKPIEKSGKYLTSGILSPITIDVEKDSGEYNEPNIWIQYKQKNP